MSKKLSYLLITTAILGTGVSVSMSETAQASTLWVPRSVEQIKSDFLASGSNHYVIQWGDTLSAISGATNIKIEKLAELNGIGNINVIFAGNTLVFEGNKAIVQSTTGQVITESVIEEEDKVVADQPIGQSTTNDDCYYVIKPDDTYVTPPNDESNQDGTDVTPVPNPEPEPSPSPTPTPEPVPDPTPTPDPEPTPDPTPVETGWSVWYTADDSAHSDKNIVLGQHVFGSRLEAQQWIENYADSLLMQGISAANYGASSWNN